MEKYEIQKLRDLPIEKVAKQMRMVLKHHKALCPFHDDHHASLSFNTRKNSCRCYVCMRDSMGTIDLVMKFLGKDFISACRWLAEVNGVYLEDSHRRWFLLLLPPPLYPLPHRKHLRKILPKLLRRHLWRHHYPPPSMPGSMRDSLSIPGSTGRLEDSFSRKEGLMREWRDGAD